MPYHRLDNVRLFYLLRVLSGDNAEENPVLKEHLCSIQIDLIKIVNLLVCVQSHLSSSSLSKRQKTCVGADNSRAGGGPRSGFADSRSSFINTVQPTLKEALNTTINSAIMKFGLFVTILSCSSLFFGGHCIDTEEGTSCTNSDATCTDSPV